MSADQRFEFSLSGNGQIVVIHFSSRNRKVGSFDRYPVPDCVGNIYVNPGSPNWYLDGVGFDFGVDETISILNEACKGYGAEKIYCIGSSMGAWGAAYIGEQLGANATLLFGPELTLNIYSGFSRENNIDGDFPSLKCSDTKHNIVAGVLCPSDVVNAIYFGRKNGNSFFCLNDCGHASAKFLKDKGVLRDVIERFVGGGNLDLSNFLISPDLLAKLSRDFGCPVSFSEVELSRYADLMHSHDMKLSSSMQVVDHLLGRKLYLVASEWLDRSKIRYSDAEEILYRMCRVNRKMKRFSVAVDLANQLRKSPAYKKLALFELAQIEARLNGECSALSLYKALCEEHSTDPFYKVAFGKLAE